MGNRKSFVVHFSTCESIEDFDDAELGKLFRAMYLYAKTGKEMTLSKSLKVAFRFIKSQMDSDHAKYVETCEKRREAGASSAQKRADKKATNANKCQQNEQMPTNATDVDVDVDVDVDNNMTRHITTIRERVRADEFSIADRKLVESFCDVADEVINMGDETVVINQSPINASYVKYIFSKCDYYAMEHAISRFRSNRNNVVKTKPYMRTLLYNAIIEMNPQIEQEARRDFMYGGLSNG